MITHFRIAIVLLSVLCVTMTVVGLEEKKCCAKDFDCASNEQCSNQKCKDACIRHPCAENAICKVSKSNAVLVFAVYFCRVSFKTDCDLRFLFDSKAKFHVPLCSCARGFVGNPFLDCVPMDVMRRLAKPKQNRPFRHK